MRQLLTFVTFSEYFTCILHLYPGLVTKGKNKHIFHLNADGAFLISFSDAHLFNERSSCMLTIIIADLARKTPQRPLVDYKRN